MQGPRVIRHWRAIKGRGISPYHLHKIRIDLLKLARSDPTPPGVAITA
jgi:hypothetical protein